MTDKAEEVVGMYGISHRLDSLTSPDYTLNNPDTLTKYKTAAQISHKVLEAVIGRQHPCVLAPRSNYVKDGVWRAKRSFRYVNVATNC